ncbi:hypothetical protein FRB93_001552, partial [Tulasnella sp. JGI-2019a]
LRLCSTFFEQFAQKVTQLEADQDITIGTPRICLFNARDTPAPQPQRSKTTRTCCIHLPIF